MLSVFLGHILWSLAAIVVPGGMCYLAARRYRAERDARVRDLQQQSERAAAAGAQAAGSLARRCGSGSGSGATPAAPLQRDSLREPLLSIPEDSSDASGGEALPVQTLQELPACVRTFLARSIRDGRSFRRVGQAHCCCRQRWRTCCVPAEHASTHSRSWQATEIRQGIPATRVGCQRQHSCQLRSWQLLLPTLLPPTGPAGSLPAGCLCCSSWAR